MASREYSSRLGTLSDDQLQAALERFGLGELVAAEPLTNGLFGQNLMLKTTAGDFVFRGAPHWNPAGEDDWQFPKERFFSALVHVSEGGPKVPWPYLLDEGREIFGWGFAVQPRLAGDVLQQPMRRHYSPQELREQSRELGLALAALHTVTVPEAGTFDVRSGGIRPYAGSYADYVEATIERLLAESVAASNATSEDDVAWARSVVASARPALELPFEPTVIHLDFGFHNVLFEQNDGAWRLTGVIDWMTAEAGHPEADLARPLATDHQYKIGGREEFLAAYRGTHPEPTGFGERFRAFMLWERLLIWEYWQRNKGFKEGLGVRQWMETFVEILG